MIDCINKCIYIYWNIEAEIHCNSSENCVCAHKT